MGNIIPTIYFATDKLNRKAVQAKIGIVEKQLVETRRKQFDTTFQSSAPEIVDEFPLDLTRKTKRLIERKSKTKKSYIEIIESAIHNDDRLINFRKEWVKPKEEISWEEFVKLGRRVILENIDKFTNLKSDIELVALALRYYQTGASICVFKELIINEKDRATIVHCTRSGKTWTSIECFLKIRNNTDVFDNGIFIQMEPNSLLVSQNARAASMRLKSLGYKVKSIIIGGSESKEEIEVIAARLKETDNSYITLITCTYQSKNRLKQILLQSNVTPDFMVLDEAHRLTGKKSKVWKDVLDNKLFNVKKRLLITASPVIYSQDSTQFFGFEDIEQTGNIVHRYTLSEAIEDGYISPVEVIGLKLDKDKVDLIRDAYLRRRQVIQENLFDMYKIELPSVEEEVNRNEGDVVFFLQLYNIISAIKQGLVTHPIVYCNSIKRSKLFVEALVQIAKKDFDLDIPFAVSLDSKQDLKNRDKMLQESFAKASIGVITNVQCLKEGIDVSAIDSVFFVDKRSSGVDIIQIFGRPLNKVEGKIARIFLPIFLEKTTEGIQILDAHYRDTLGWIKSLLNAQDSFKDFITSISYYDPEKAQGNVHLSVTRTGRRRLTRERNIDREIPHLEPADLGAVVEDLERETLLRSAKMISDRKNLSSNQKLALVERFAHDIIRRDEIVIDVRMNALKYFYTDNKRRFEWEERCQDEQFYVDELIKISSSILKLSRSKAIEILYKQGLKDLYALEEKFYKILDNNIMEAVSKYSSRWELNQNEGNLQAWIAKSETRKEKFFSKFPDYICDKNQTNKKFIKDFFLKYKGLSRKEFENIKGPMYDKGNRMYGGNWYLMSAYNYIGGNFWTEIQNIMGWRANTMKHSKENTLKEMKKLSKKKATPGSIAISHSGYIAHAKREGYWDECLKVLNPPSKIKTAKELTTGITGTYEELADHFSKVTGKKISKAVINIKSKSGHLIVDSKSPLKGFQFKTLD